MPQLNIYEAQDDGFVNYYPGSGTYSVIDYTGYYGVNVITAESTGQQQYSAAVTRRAFKRFAMNLGGMKITEAVLYWHLQGNAGNYPLGCRLDLIPDYGTLDIGDYNITVIENLGEVMGAAASLGWKSLDITDQVNAYKAASYIAFRWQVNGTAPAGYTKAFYLRALEETPAYIALTYEIGKINIGDEWREIEEVKINIGDEWRDVTRIKLNVGNTWRDVF